MRGKRISPGNVYVREMERMNRDPIMFAKKQPTSPLSRGESSPVSIFNMPSLPLPPIEPLPRSLSMPANHLPPTVTWADKSKVERSKQRQRSRLEELSEEHFPSEKQRSHRHLPVKSKHIEAKGDAHLKVKERSLLKKHWIKVREARRDALAEEEALAAAWNGEEIAEDNERKPPRATAAKREKVRRNQRRLARDQKCYAAWDPIEADALDHDKPAKKPKVKNPFKGRRFRAMMQRESSGAALSDVFQGGVMLSCAAARDLKMMMVSCGRLQTPQELESLFTQRPTTPHMALGYLHAVKHRAKMAGHRGSRSILRQPATVKAQGKRRS